MEFKFNFREDDQLKETIAFSKEHANEHVREQSVIEHNCVSRSLADILQDWNNNSNVYSTENIATETGHHVSFVQPLSNTCQVPVSKGNEAGGKNDMELTESKVSENFLQVSDLVPGVYEGGFKVWDCSIDLVDFMYESKMDLSCKTFLEVGCGIGLPGIAAANIGAAKVVFQDFNDFVITEATGPSVCLNEWIKMKNSAEDINDIALVNHMDEAVEELRNHKLAVSDKYTFISGDWSEVPDLLKEKTDVIVTSETIYDPSSYSKLHHLLKSTIADDGVIFVAAKSYYFGVGGGTHQWQEFVRTQAYFQIELARTVNAPLKREILKMKKLI